MDDLAGLRAERSLRTEEARHRDAGARRLLRAVEARRHLPGGGRAWLNGHEIGGTEPRHVALSPNAARD